MNNTAVQLLSCAHKLRESHKLVQLELVPGKAKAVKRGVVALVHCPLKSYPVTRGFDHLIWLL